MNYYLIIDKLITLSLSFIELVFILFKVKLNDFLFLLLQKMKSLISDCEKHLETYLPMVESLRYKKSVFYIFL